MQLFISSPLWEFEAERRILHITLTRILRFRCLLGEYFCPGSPTELMENIQECIDDSSVVILLLGASYGSLSPMDISWTEYEIGYANQIGKLILPYMRKKLPRYPEVAQTVFKEYVENNIASNIPRFKNSNELVAFVTRDVLYIQRKFEEEQYLEGFE